MAMCLCVCPLQPGIVSKLRNGLSCTGFIRSILHCALAKFGYLQRRQYFSLELSLITMDL